MKDRIRTVALDFFRFDNNLIFRTIAGKIFRPAFCKNKGLEKISISLQKEILMIQDMLKNYYLSSFIALTGA